MKYTCRTCRWVEYLPTRPGMMQNLKCALPEGFLMDAQVPHEDWGCTDWEAVPSCDKCRGEVVPGHGFTHEEGCPACFRD
jgi:hypothetical protein